MNLTLTEEQRLLADSFAIWLTENYDAAQKERSTAAQGCDPAVWQSWAELGWLALALPEEAGGLGADLLTSGLLFKELGAHWVVEPFRNCIFEAQTCLALWARTPAQQTLLQDSASGAVRIAMVHTEPGMALPWAAPALRAHYEQDHWVLTGHKALVSSAQGAAWWIVSAVDPDGVLRLFTVDPASSGVCATHYLMADGRSGTDIEFTQCRVPDSGVLAPVSGLPSVSGIQECFERTLARSVILSGWEMAGGMHALWHQTVLYTQQRHQFGRALSDFQVVQHRLAEMWVACTEALAACELASLRTHQDPEQTLVCASMLHSKLARSARYVAQQAVQLHGGMGVCEELSVAHGFRHLECAIHRAGAQSRHAVAYGHHAWTQSGLVTSATLPAVQSLIPSSATERAFA